MKVVGSEGFGRVERWLADEHEIAGTGLGSCCSVGTCSAVLFVFVARGGLTQL